MTHDRLTRVVRIGAVAASTAFALILAGCAGSGRDNASADEESFTLSYASAHSASISPYTALADAYMDENPNVTITMNEIPVDSYPQTLTTQLNSGNAADAFATAPGQGQGSILELAQADLISPLDDEAAKVIPAGSESQFQVDGKTYGVALGLRYVGTLLNETTAESLGATYPTDYDALLATCQSLAADGKALFVLAGAMPRNPGTMVVVIAATRVYAENPDWNQDRADGKTTFADSEGWQETLQTVIELHEAGCFQKGAEGAGIDALTAQMLQGAALSAFVPSGFASILNQQAPDQEFTIQAFPPAAGGKAFGLVNADYAVSLNSNAKNADAAEKFLAWAATNAGQKVYSDAAGSLPLGSDLSSTVFMPVADIVNNGDYVPLPNSSWPNAAVYDALSTGVQGLLTGQKTPDDVLKEMDAAWG